MVLVRYKVLELLFQSLVCFTLVALLLQNVHSRVVQELQQWLRVGPSLVGLQLPHRIIEAVNQIVQQDGVVLLQLVHPLTHFLSVLYYQAHILLVERPGASVRERALVVIHLRWRVEAAAVVRQLQVKEVLQLRERQFTYFAEVLSYHV